jgi:hypothetical protein
MQALSDARREARLKLTAATLFLCAAGSLGWVIWTAIGGLLLSLANSWVGLAGAKMSSVAFLCASILVFLKPRLGYSLGAIAGVIAVPWFVESEIRPSGWNSWVSLNYESPWPIPVEGSYLAFSGMKILAVFLVVTTVAYSLLRLLSDRWSFRRALLPAFAVSFLVLAVWFAYSAVPYSIPAYDHPAHAELRILHVEKRGLQFHEVRVLERRDGQVWVVRNDRQLFQYRFEQRVGWAALFDASPGTLERSRAFAQSPALWNLQTASPTLLHSWNAEGWYVVLKDSKVLTFTSELGTSPPKEVTDLFYQIENLPLHEEQWFAARDVWLGFCYDPVAGLGFGVLPQRIRLLRSNSQAPR